MKLRLPRFQYEYEVTINGIKASQKNFEDNDDKFLYYSILEGLNVDFKNAPVDTGYSNLLQQQIVYVMRNNLQYDMEVDEIIDIQTGQESLNLQQFVIMMNKMSPNVARKPINTDLQ